MRYDIYKIEKTHSRRAQEGVLVQETSVIQDGMTRTEANDRILDLWHELFADMGDMYPIAETNWGKIKKATEKSLDYAFTHNGLRGFYYGADKYEVVADWDKLENMKNKAYTDNIANNDNIG